MPGTYNDPDLSLDLPQFPEVPLAPVRVVVRLPRALVDRIRATGMTQTKFLERAAERYLLEPAFSSPKRK